MNAMLVRNHSLKVGRAPQDNFLFDKKASPSSRYALFPPSPPRSLSRRPCPLPSSLPCILQNVIKPSSTARDLLSHRRRRRRLRNRTLLLLLWSGFGRFSSLSTLPYVAAGDQTCPGCLLPLSFGKGTPKDASWRSSSASQVQLSWRPLLELPDKL